MHITHLSLTRISPGKLQMGEAGRSLAVVALLLFLGGCGRRGEDADTRSLPAAPAEAPQDGTGPRALVEAWVEMWNRYDLDRVGELFIADDRLTYFSSEYEGVIRGFQAILDHHRGFGFVPGGEDRGVRLWLEDLEEDRFGEAAVLTAIWYFQRAPEGSQLDSEPPQRGPVTFVCLETRDGWRFVHMTFGNYPDSPEQ